MPDSVLQIGEAARRYEISRRTLRYWEETGILQSARAENGYRYYDGANAARIRQIVLLRRLRVPIADIERIFRADDGAPAVQLLTRHLEQLRAESANLDATATVIEALLQNLQGGGLPAVFGALERQARALQILLSERKTPMFTDESVRIVRLPAMTVAAFCFGPYGTHDGGDAANKALERFMRANELLARKPDVRRFNLCAHKKDANGNYDAGGYVEHTFELWLTVPEALDVPERVTELHTPVRVIRRQFAGGLYAAHTIPCGAYEEWAQVHAWGWRQEHVAPDYASRTTPQTSDRCWDLEEVLDFSGQMTGRHPGQQQVDLLLPIQAKEGKR